MAPNKFMFSTEQRNQLLRAYAEVCIVLDEQRQLRRKVKIRFVVGSSRKQDAEAVVLLNIVSDNLVALSLSVAQVVRLVNQHNPIASRPLRKFTNRL